MLLRLAITICWEYWKVEVSKVNRSFQMSVAEDGEGDSTLIVSRHQKGRKRRALSVLWLPTPIEIEVGR